MPTTATTEAPSATGERQETVLMAQGGAPASPGDTCAANGLELSDSGNFELGCSLGRGGMGVVYKMRDTSIDRDVAIKVMLTRLRESDLQVRRFRQEAQITGRLEHPNIVPVHHFGAAADGSMYYTMKYLQGVTLQAILDKLRQGDEETIAAWPLDSLLRVFEKVCDALAFAHANNVLHRDIKPENIMVGGYGEVLVVDWGLAKLMTEKQYDESELHALADEQRIIEELDCEAPKTQAGHLIGTPSYVAPEQIRKSLGPADQRIDVYALGAMLYAVLTLRPPFAGTIEEMIGPKLQGELEPPHTRVAKPLPHLPNGRVPEALSAVAMKAMSVSLDHRYLHVSELHAELQAYHNGFATLAEEASTVKLILLMLRRHRNEVALITASSLLIIAVLAISAFYLLGTQNQLRSAEVKATLLDDQLSHLHSQREKRGESASDSAARAFDILGGIQRQLDTDNPDAAPLNFQPRITPDGLAIDLSQNPKLKNLAALKGLPLVELRLDRTGVKDLAPLAGMRLRYFSAAETGLTSIEPLASMPLRAVDLAESGVASIEAIVGPELQFLNLRDTPVQLIAPLQNAGNLTGLVIPLDILDLDLLRNRPNLKFLSYTTYGEKADLFWLSHNKGTP
ncbi:MAG TPA: hypothetical protein DCR55_08640 [Lentisphaeria bacterium]|nr:hypothetical protein [Lentisphaeria bacterium]